MNRRDFLSGLAVAAAYTPFTLAAQCVPVASGITGCTYRLSKPFDIVQQDCLAHCWAASIAGVFGYLGHPVNQDAIASEMFRTSQCLPAPTRVINTVLSHQWRDNAGVDFTGRINGLFDPMNGIVNMNNIGLLAGLQADKPLLYCNTSHCMVIVEMDVRMDMYGNLIAIDRVVVADPFGYNGFHQLSKPEMMPMGRPPAGMPWGQLTYVASVDVD